MAHSSRSFFYFISDTTLFFKLCQFKLCWLQIRIVTLGLYQKLELLYGTFSLFVAACI